MQLKKLFKNNWPWQRYQPHNQTLLASSRPKTAAGHAADAPSSLTKDPLYNMLMHLQDVTTCNEA